MIPLSILLAIGAAIAFFWAVDHDQFDESESRQLRGSGLSDRFRRFFRSVHIFMVTYGFYANADGFAKLL